MCGIVIIKELLYNMCMNFLKKYFVPHKINNFKPHIFRELSAFVIFLTIIALFLVAVSGRVLIGTDFTALVLPKVLVDYANQDRDTKNYGHLAINSVLEKAAQMKADDMAAKGYFAHKSPDGKTPWYWFQQVGYDFSYAGENLAVNFSDSVDVNTAWMNSPGHRDNILNSNFSEVGIATAEGMYQGRKTTFVVQLFGRPAEVSSTPAKTVTNTTKKTETKPVRIASATSSAVLSESVSTEVLGENGTNELYVSAQKGQPLEASSGRMTATTVNPKIKYSNFFERALLSPEKSLSILYSLIALIIIIGLVCTTFVEFRAHNLRAMFLAIGLLLVIFGLLYVYKTLIITPLLIQ